jgi:glucose/arabinose dehydrogenase
LRQGCADGAVIRNGKPGANRERDDGAVRDARAHLFHSLHVLDLARRLKWFFAVTRAMIPSSMKAFGRMVWFCLFPLFLFASQIHGQAPTGLTAIRVASSLTQPLFVTAPPGDFNRVFIVRQTGQVHILKLDTGLLNGTAFLDIQARLTGTNGEEGLLGMAFDPNYASNGKFYLNYNVPGGAFGAGITRVSQFQVTADPDIADTGASEKILLSFDQPQDNHNGGWIGFSPRVGDENNLYIASGDGGAGNDQGPGHTEPGGNAQDVASLLGKMLRIHVDSATGTYTIPPNNPFAISSRTDAKREIWALGLRNPFRDSFDRLNGFLFIGDVGQSSREEVDVQKPSHPGGGENYGWRDREGLIQNPGFPTPAPTATPNPPRVDPIIDYDRSVGGTVIGGYVYRGTKILNLVGTYVFGDYAVSQIFSMNYDGTTASNFQNIRSQLFPIPLVGGGSVDMANPSSFGEDGSGELYIADIGNGNIYKIVPVLASVVSRKMHDLAGPFDVDLPLSGPAGIECRSGPDHTLVFNFSNPLMSVGSASVTAGSGSVNSSSINANDARQYIVNLTGVANNQTTTVSLTNVIDAANRSRGAFSVSMRTLLGDTNGNGAVNSTDVSQTQFESGHILTATNFRTDVTVNGQINSTDVSTVQAQSGSSIDSPKRRR